MTKQEESTEQLDKALTEMDVIATEDRNIFRVDTDTFRFQKIEYKLIEDYKEGFDMEMMEARFIDYLLKYDYIVGDIAYEKLRLRGFYDDHRKGVPIDMKISNLEDYLVEFCNFGSQYFVFERVDKKKADPESYFKRNKKSNRSKKGSSSNRRNQQNKNQQNKNQQNKNQQKKQNQPKKKQHNKKSNQKNTNKNKPKQSGQTDFQVVKKEAQKTNKPQTKKAPQKQQSKPKSNKKQFEIRKKKDE